MKCRNLKRQTIAWMLLVTFMVALGIKGSHYHFNEYQKSEQSTSHFVHLADNCVICDYSMHKACDTTPYIYMPVVVSHVIEKPQPMVEDVVYRPVLMINAHAPPHICA